MSSLRPANTISTLHPSRIVLYFLVFLLIVYTALRAISVSFTHDEAFTFFYYVNRPWAETLKVTFTNNHLLNSILAKFTCILFGESEIALRLPNVLGGALFFIFGARLVARLSSGKWFPVFALAALTLNPFVIEFFGLCRGYGLSLGLLMAALYAQYRALEEKKQMRYEVLALLFSALALLANYTLFNFFLIHAAFVFASVLLRVIKSKSEPALYKFYLRRYIPFAAVTLAFTILFLRMMLRLNEGGNFGFGGNGGFWDDTVGSLAIYSCYPFVRTNGWIVNYVKISAGIFFVAAFTVTVISIVQRRHSLSGKFLAFLMIAVSGSGTAIFIQHHLLGVPYSVDRTAIYFIPLFALLVIGFLSSYEWLKLIRYPVLALLFLPMPIAVFYIVNLNTVIFWPLDSRMQEATSIMISDAENSTRKDEHLLVDVPFEVKPTFNYYVYRSNTKAIALCRVDENNLRREADWVMAFTDDTSEMLKSHFHEIGIADGKRILKRNSPVVYTSVAIAGAENFENNAEIQRNSAPGFNSGKSDLLHGQQHYSREIQYAIPDSLLSANVFVFSCMVRAKEIPAHLLGVFRIIRNGTVIEWRDWGIDSDLRSEEEWERMTMRMRPSIPLESGDLLGFYLINESSDPVWVDDFTVEVFRTD